MLRTLVRPALPAAFVALLTPGLLLAQAQGRVKVAVVDENGEPVAGATATISSDEIGYHKVLETNKRGEFAVIFVDGTLTYDVLIEKEGHRPARGRLDPNPGDNVETELVLPTATSQAAGGARETGPAANPVASAFNDGVTALQAGDYPTAKEKFHRAMELNPKLAEAPAVLAGIYAEEGDHEQAEAMAQEALAIEPDNFRALRALYDVYDERGDQAKAQEMLDRLKTLEGGTDVAVRVFNEGAEATRRGDFETARARFEEAVTIDPELVPAYVALSRVYLDLGEYDESIEAAEKTLELDPDDTAVLRYQHEAYRLKGDTAKAAELFEKISAADPKGTGEALHQRGIALFNQNEMVAAQEALEQALEIDPDRAKAHYTLGLAYVNTGDNAKAREHFERFLEMAPEDPDAASAREMLEYLAAS